MYEPITVKALMKQDVTIANGIESMKLLVFKASVGQLKVHATYCFIEATMKLFADGTFLSLCPSTHFYEITDTGQLVTFHSVMLVLLEMIVQSPATYTVISI